MTTKGWLIASIVLFLFVSFIVSKAQKEKQENSFNSPRKSLN